MLTQRTKVLYLRMLRIQACAAQSINAFGSLFGIEVNEDNALHVRFLRT